MLPQVISRKGQFDPKEVEMINRYVKKRDGKMTERRESIRRESLDAEAIATAARRALAELDLEEKDGEEGRSLRKERPSTGSTTPDQSTGIPSAAPPNAAPTKGSKGGHAREVRRCAEAGPGFVKRAA